jgi:hypothetical protein
MNPGRRSHRTEYEGTRLQPYFSTVLKEKYLVSRSGNGALPDGNEGLAQPIQSSFNSLQVKVRGRFIILRIG